MFRFIFLALFLAPSFSLARYPVTSADNPFSGSKLFLPTDEVTHPAILLLHGSEGGSERTMDARAAVLATQGFIVLAYCYFDCGRGLVGQRKPLKDVEVLKVLEAISWLKNYDRSTGKVAVYGFSRGAELSMIIGEVSSGTPSAPDAIVAHSPSDQFNSVFNWSWFEPACWICKKVSCPDRSDLSWNDKCGDNPKKIDDKLSAWRLKGKAVRSGRKIQIEKFNGPILLSHGEKDTVWPVEQTKRLEKRLRDAGKAPEVYYFPNGDHSLIGKAELKRSELVGKFLDRYLK